MAEYMARTHTNNGARVVQPKIGEIVTFEIKFHIIKELRDMSFSRTVEEDSNEHVDKVLEIFKMFNLLSVSKDRIMLTIFPKTLIRAARIWIKSEPRGYHLDKDCPLKDEAQTKEVKYGNCLGNLFMAIQVGTDKEYLYHPCNKNKPEGIENKNVLKMQGKSLLKLENKIGRLTQTIKGKFKVALIGCLPRDVVADIQRCKVCEIHSLVSKMPKQDVGSFYRMDLNFQLARSLLL
ncbi:hypothetical protein Tco_1333589 [Tanacetum coccineum]